MEEGGQETKKVGTGKEEKSCGLKVPTLCPISPWQYTCRHPSISMVHDE